MHYYTARVYYTALLQSTTLHHPPGATERIRRWKTESALPLALVSQCNEKTVQSISRIFIFYQSVLLIAVLGIRKFLLAMAQPGYPNGRSAAVFFSLFAGGVQLFFEPTNPFSAWFFPYSRGGFSFLATQMAKFQYFFPMGCSEPWGGLFSLHLPPIMYSHFFKRRVWEPNTGWPRDPKPNSRIL